MFAFLCPKCQKTLKSPLEQIGARTKCPYCGCPVQVPSGPDVPVVACAVPAALKPTAPIRSEVSLAWSIAAGLVLLPIAVIAVLAFSWTRGSKHGEPSSAGKSIVPTAEFHRGTDLPKSHKPEAVDVGHKPELDVRDAEVDVETRFGNLGVTVSVRVGNLCLVMPIQNRFTDGSNFLVGIKYTNYDDSTVIRVKSQSTGNFGLTDDKGNIYRRYIPTDEFGGEWPLLAFISGSPFYDLRKNEVGSVRSDRRVTDLLIFEEPLPGAKSLTLVLDASRWGGMGKFRVVIERGKIVTVHLVVSSEGAGRPLR
jgi:hypothetical protein